MAAEKSRHPYNLGISGIESDRPLEGSIRSNPIEIDLLLNPSHLGVGLLPGSGSALRLAPRLHAQAGDPPQRE